MAAQVETQTAEAADNAGAAIQDAGETETSETVTN